MRSKVNKSRKVQGLRAMRKWAERRTKNGLRPLRHGVEQTKTGVQFFGRSRDSRRGGGRLRHGGKVSGNRAHKKGMFRRGKERVPTREPQKSRAGNSRLPQTDYLE